MNYIGIRGHRGAGKASIAFLLGQTIETMYRFPNLSDISFSEMYERWCKSLMKDVDEAYSETGNYRVYYESFSDNITVLVQLFLGCPDEYLTDDYKDDIIVNIKDLSCCHRESWTGSKLITANEMFAKIDTEAAPQNIVMNHYMTMREFILYFGMEIMQRFFGKNVWVNMVRSTSLSQDKWFDNDGVSFKIFRDLKTSAEAQFIKDLNGVIIKVVRPSNKKTIPC